MVVFYLDGIFIVVELGASEFMVNCLVVENVKIMVVIVFIHKVFMYDWKIK